MRLREESVRAEYESGMRGIEALRASCLDEHNKMRARYEDDLHQARLEVEKRRQSMDNEREVLALRKLSDSNEIESARVQVALKEKHLVELQASIGRSKVELEVAQKLIEPGVRAAEAEREEARRIRAQADNVMRAAEEHASAVLLAEQGRRYHSLSISRARACAHIHTHVRSGGGGDDKNQTYMSNS